VKVHHYYFLTAFVIAVMVSWMCRFTVISASSGDGSGMAYRLDRWTGRIVFLRFNEIREMK